jgi:hypothetical protein
MMQNKNVQDEEKDGYSDIVDEMQVTAGYSSTILIDEEGVGRSNMKSKRKKCSNSRRHPGYYRRKLQG